MNAKDELLKRIQQANDEWQAAENAARNERVAMRWAGRPRADIQDLELAQSVRLGKLAARHQALMEALEILTADENE